MNLTPRTTRILPAAILLLFLGAVASTYNVFNDTIDEGIHIACGLEYWQNGEYTNEPQHPPLARATSALLPYLFSDLRWDGGFHLWDGGWGKLDAAGYWKSLRLARAGNLIFAAAMMIFVYLWALKLHGRRAALAAACLAGLSPSLLAHSGLATVDMAATSALLAAAYCLWRWSREPGWRWCLLSAAAVGAALTTKFSILGFLPLIGAAYFVVARRERRPAEGVSSAGSRREGVARAAVFLLLIAVVIWAVYRFDVGPLSDPGNRYTPKFLQPGQQSPAGRLIEAVGDQSLPAPMFWRGIVEVLDHNRGGHRAYLLGEFRQHGWWYFFWVVLGVKTTLPLLLLTAFGIVLWIRGGRSGSGEMVFAVIPIAVIMGLGMAANINIGVRHILPLYPFLAIVAAAPFRGADRIGGRPGRGMAIPLLLLAWHAGESLWAYPDYLPYFNQIARGRELEFLADSNLDWGQDLARLGAHLEDKGIESVTLVYFGRTDPKLMGVDVSPLPDSHPDFGWVAISVNHLLGVEGRFPAAEALRRREPQDRVGKSIRLYRMAGPRP